MTLIFILLGIFTLGVSSGAGALQFTLSSYTVSLHTSGSGLEVYTQDILSEPTTWNLEEGNRVAFNLFRIGTNEEAVDSDDLTSFPVSVLFNFTNPGSVNTAIGETWGQVNSGDDWGVIEWNNPINFTFLQPGLADLGRFHITLENANFGTPGYNDIQAVLTYDHAPVPEPATMFLVGSGLIGIGFFSRKKFRKRVNTKS